MASSSIPSCQRSEALDEQVRGEVVAHAQWSIRNFRWECTARTIPSPPATEASQTQRQACLAQIDGRPALRVCMSPLRHLENSDRTAVHNMLPEASCRTRSSEE